MIIVRNMNIKGDSAEGSEGGLSGRFLSLSMYDHINRNKKRVLLIRSQMKVRNMLLERKERQSCYKVAGSLAKLCSMGFWEIELFSDKLGYLTEEISRQTQKVKSGFSLLLMVKYDKKEVNLGKNCQANINQNMIV